MFKNLNKLTTVYMSPNECIKENFLTPDRIAEMSEIVTRNCGFCRSNEDIGNCDMLHELRAILVSEQNKQIRILESSLKTHEQTQLNLIKEFKVAIEKQYIGTLSTNTEELRSADALSVKKIEELTLELKKKDDKIKILEEKIELSKKTNPL